MGRKARTFQERRKFERIFEIEYLNISVHLSVSSWFCMIVPYVSDIALSTDILASLSRIAWQSMNDIFPCSGECLKMHQKY
jgi:hypothetical protein